MPMGNGLKMYLMAQGRNESGSRGDDRQRNGRTYNLDGTYNVSVNGGGNRTDRGYQYTGGMNRQGGERMAAMDDPEARYRGKDGRYHAGTRRSEYEGDRMRMGGDDNEDEKEYKVKVSPESRYPYMPPYMPQKSRQDGDYGRERESNYGYDGSLRQIGFGASMMDGHGDMDDYPMQRGMAHSQPMEFDQQTAERWVKSMQNEDKNHPEGGKWTPEMLKPLARKFNVPTEGKKFWEFYAMSNAMYSDYCEVVKKFGIVSPEFYAQMAKAFMDDKDAVPDKVAAYYEFLVDKDA